MWGERTTATLRQERAGHSVGSASDFNLATSSSGRPLFEVDQALHHDSHLLVNLAITESVQGRRGVLATRSSPRVFAPAPELVRKVNQ